MADTTSLLELIRTIRLADGSSLRRAQADLFDRFHGRLLRFASRGLFSEARRHESASDVVMIGLNAFLQAIRSGRFCEEDPASSWEALAFAIVQNKMRKAQRAATAARRDRGRESEMDPETLESRGTVDALDAVEAFESLLHWIELQLPEADGSRRLFRLSIIEGMADEGIAKITNLSSRSVGSRWRVVLSHIVDLALADSGLSDRDRQVIALTLDPRTRLTLGNTRVSLDKRVKYTAEELGISPEDVTNRLQRALGTLVTRLLDESSDAPA